MPRFALTRSVLFALCLAAGASLNARATANPHSVLDARRVDGTAMGAPLDLSSAWLIQVGDDPRYSGSNFDDSQWQQAQPARTLASFGLRNVNRIWYRSHVQVRPGQTNLALLVRSFVGSYVLFVNGVNVGSSGVAPPGGAALANFDQRFSIPAELAASGSLTIAIRAQIARASEYGTRLGGIAPITRIQLGNASLLSDQTALYTFRNYSSNAINILTELMVPLLALALALTLPKEREYVALVFSGTAGLVMDLISVWRSTHNLVQTGSWAFLNGLLSGVAIIASLEFVRLVLGLRRSKWWVSYEWLIGVLMVTLVPAVNTFFATGAKGPANAFVVGVIVLASLVTLPFSLGLPLLALGVWWTKRKPDALLLFVPLFLSAAIQYIQFALQVFNRMHITQRGSLPRVPINVLIMEWSEVASFLFTLALLLFLVLRTVRIARSRAAMASDLHAVQTVQEILLARASHDTPGFVVEHVYHPAQEVGGDFFLVSPGPDGSITAIVGDVSGKGLVAAMRVSMILGVLRREEQRAPEAILRNLNDALLMQGEMGFTTACCVQMMKDGRYIIANAGHIAPYVAGQEIATQDSLPLGIAPDQQYGQICGHLPVGKTMVLMSDGVVEARSAKGELYGFERLPQLTLMTAVDIADVARRFGQEDDITVLTLACA